MLWEAAVTNWLLTYSQWTGSQHKTANKTIAEMHPAAWLAEMHEIYPDAQTVLLFAVEITSQQIFALRQRGV